MAGTGASDVNAATGTGIGIGSTAPPTSSRARSTSSVCFCEESMEDSRSISISANNPRLRRLTTKSQPDPANMYAKKMYGKMSTGNGGTG